MNGNHRLAEPVQFFLRLALGRLDHHCARDRPGDCRRVKAVIHEALRHIFDRDALERAQIENAFVGDHPILAFVQHGKTGIEPFGNIIGIEDGDLRGLGQPGGSH